MKTYIKNLYLLPAFTVFSLAIGASTSLAAVTEAWVHRSTNVVSDANDRAQAVAVDGSGNVVVTGFSFNGFTNADYYTAKYAVADGALLWEHRYNGPANSDDYANAIAVDASGDVVVTGTSNSGTNGGSDYYTAKYAAANGALLWEKRYNTGPGYSENYAHAVAVDGSRNVVVTGYTYDGNNSDYYTAKYAAADGALLWEQRYDGPANSGDGANAVAVDGSGNVVVTGSSVGSDNIVVSGFGQGTDYYTAKYAAADGALLWEKRYNGPANFLDVANAVAVDGSGNVVVTGYSYNTNFNADYYADYYTAKYAAADGALLWEKRYSYGRANAVAVDGSGNVVVTGESEYDYYTAKYAAADGALLWEKRYNGPPGPDSYSTLDEARAVAVDGSGNVVVTGISGAGNQGFGLYGGDYYTAKYAAANGALLWEKRYNGPANGCDSAVSLALGPNGMVAIAGSSGGNYCPRTTSDYATVVYRENLPLVSIELVPTGVRIRFTGVPGHIYEVQRALAVTGPWPPINTQTAPIGGLIEYVDTTPPTATAFYRISAL